MPKYSYKCTSCGAGFESSGVPYEERNSQVCPCERQAEATLVWAKFPGVISGLDNIEGRINEGMDVTHIAGERMTVGSRRELEEVQKRARERYFEATDQERRAMRPILNETTGQYELEEVITNPGGNGVDIGEIRQVDETSVNERAGEKDEAEWRELEKKAAAQVTDDVVARATEEMTA